MESPRERAGTPPAALLIHGLGGTAYDLGVLDKQLRRAGVVTHTLTLPGHGGEPQDLLDVRAEDWLEAVRTRYRELRAEHETLHVVGMCMGALLAVELAKQEEHVQGSLIALAPPVYIDGWSTPWYRALRHVVYRIPGLAARMRVDEGEPYGIKNDLIRSIVKAKFARGDRFHYPWVPLACIREVDRLRGWVMRDLDRIRARTLVMHAEEDELTTPRSAWLLVRHIRGARLELLHDSYHMICIDNERDRVIRSVLEHMGIEHRKTAT